MLDSLWLRTIIKDTNTDVMRWTYTTTNGKRTISKKSNISEKGLSETHSDSFSF